MGNNTTFQHSMQKIAGVIQRNQYFNAITNALMSLLPVTIVGSLGSLINAIPIASYQSFLVDSGLKTITSIPNEITNNLLALYAVFLIASKYAKSQEIDGVIPGLLSLMAFLIVTPYGLSEAGTMNGLLVSWMGARGLFTAFIIALVVGKIYTTFQVKGWVIKMPAGVPPTVQKTFSGLVPSAIIMILMLAIRFGFHLTPYGDIHTLIFKMIATPLQALGGNFLAIFLGVIIAHTLWLFGIHGTLIVYSVLIPILTPFGLENLAAFNANTPIPNIITLSLFAQAVTMGSGQTLGLAIAMLRGKSAQYRTLGKLAVVPNACGINEPIIFATPLVMNFRLALPFICVPLLTTTLAYLGMTTRLLPLLPGIAAPLGTPIMISGFLASGGAWQWVVFQLLTILISYIIYLPFFKVLDKEAYETEVNA